MHRQALYRGDEPELLFILDRALALKQEADAPAAETTARIGDLVRNLMGLDARARLYITAREIPGGRS
jgi:hypothetical protein